MLCDSRYKEKVKAGSQENYCPKEGKDLPLSLKEQHIYKFKKAEVGAEQLSILYNWKGSK